MPSDAATPRPARPLVIRLRNWVGEIMLSLPALQALEQHGYAPCLIGPAWARSLFAASGRPFFARPAGRLAAIRQLRALRAMLRGQDAGFDTRPNTLLFPRSFSSALEARLAGLQPVGRATDGRSLLLQEAVPPASNSHVSQEYWQLTAPFLGPAYTPQVPAHRDLVPTQAQQLEARRALEAHGIHDRYVVCCPLSGSGDLQGQRRWSQFGALCKALRRAGLQPVICPGPREEAAMRALCPDAVPVPGLDLGVYAAVMRQAELVIANDTGPGHLAALAGARLVSVFGPHSEARWHPLVRYGRVLHPGSRWPTLDEVLEAAGALMQHPERAAEQKKLEQYGAAEARRA